MDLIVHDLEETPFDREAPAPCLTFNTKLALAKQRHERRVSSENTQFPIERGDDDGCRVPFEQCRLGRDHRNVQHVQPWIFLAFSSTSSAPPAMKNACSGYWSNSPATNRSNDEIVSSSLTYLPLMPVNCSATENGCDIKR